MAQAKQDLGTGNIKKLMLQLMIPAVVAQVVNLLYNIVDRIYIGHIAGIGAAALTGVGLFTPILMLLNAFAMLVGAGGAPRTAIALGQGDRQQAEKIVSNSFTFALRRIKPHTPLLVRRHRNAVPSGSGMGDRAAHGACLAAMASACGGHRHHGSV